MTYASKSGFVAAGLVFSILGLIVTALRFLSRVKNKVALGFDDALIVPAAVVVVVTGITIIIGAYRNVLGMHSLPDSSSELDLEREMQKWELTFLTLHVWGTGLVRLSILFFYRRIFRGRFRVTHFDVINWTYIGLVTANLLGFFTSNLVLCVPNIDRLDTPQVTGMTLSGYCLGTQWLQAKAGVINFVLDFLVAAIPICRVTQIQMSWSRKLQAMAVFAVGLFAVAAALARMVIVVKLQGFAADHPQLDSDARIFDLEGTDTLGLISSNLFWSYIEMSLGLIVASLPSAFRLIDQSRMRARLSKMGLVSPRPSAGSGSPKESPGRKKDLTTSTASQVDSAYTSKTYLEKVAPQGTYSVSAERGYSVSLDSAELGVGAVGVKTVIDVTRDDLDVPA